MIKLVTMEWNTVHFFHGPRGHTAGTSYSPKIQFLMDIFGNESIGFFVDISAKEGDAYELSATYQLESRNWSGLCIDVNPAHVWNLSSRACKTVYAAIGTVTGAHVSFIFKGSWKRGRGKHSQKLKTITLEDLLTALHAPSRIDYLSYQTGAATTIPFHSYEFRVVSISNVSSTLHHHLIKHHYTHVRTFRDTGEQFYALN